MKTKEFIEKIEQMYLLVYESNNTVEVIDGYSGNTLAVVSKNKRFWMTTGFNSQFNNAAVLEDVLINASKLACTPLEEREEEKKYIYKLPIKNAIGSQYCLKTNGCQEDVRIGGSIYEKIAFIDSYHFTDAEVEAYSEDIQALFRACEKEEIQ